jgi:phosphoglycerate dehydrogenase-like enzyme
MSDFEVLVIRQKIHGMDATGYADTLRDRLPDCSVTLATTPTEERTALKTADVVTGFELSAKEVASADSMQLFACVFAGTSHLDLSAFEDHGVAVTNASGVHGPNISEYVVGTMIAHAKRFQRARTQQDRREWRSYQTRELHGSTATIVGLGAIGHAVTERLDAFGMETVGVRYTPEKGGPTDEVYGFDEIHEAVSDSEYVVLACPLTDTTAGLVDADIFQTMHPDAILVNVARGPVVDTEALVSALRWNRIGGATLDVTDPEPLPEDHSLWSMDNVLLTPHNSGYSPDYFERQTAILEGNIELLRDGDMDLKNRVV